MGSNISLQTRTWWWNWVLQVLQRTQRCLHHEPVFWQTFLVQFCGFSTLYHLISPERAHTHRKHWYSKYSFSSLQNASSKGSLLVVLKQTISLPSVWSYSYLCVYSSPPCFFVVGVFLFVCVFILFSWLLYKCLGLY